MPLRMFDRNIDMDNAGLVSLGALCGWLAAHKMGIVLVAPWVAQVGVSLLTMVTGAVVLHFVKRELNRRWPHEKKPKDDTV